MSTTFSAPNFFRSDFSYSDASDSIIDFTNPSHVSFRGNVNNNWISKTVQPDNFSGTVTYTTCDDQVSDSTFAGFGYANYQGVGLSPTSPPGGISGADYPFVSFMKRDDDADPSLYRFRIVDNNKNLLWQSNTTSNPVHTATVTITKLTQGGDLVIHLVCEDMLIDHTETISSIDLGLDLNFSIVGPFWTDDPNFILYDYSYSFGGSIPEESEFIIDVEPTSGKIGDLITITSNGFFDINPNNNKIFFNNILAGQVFVNNDSSLNVIVPTGATSGDVHVETLDNISNFVYFDVLYEDILFTEKPKPNGRFDFGPGKLPIYSSDYSINNFSQISDEDNIVQNIYNILLTRPGERIFNPTFGCGIHDLIFNLIESDEEIETDLLNLIGNSIELHEPRARLVRDDAIIDFNKDTGVVQLILPIELPTGSVREVGIKIGASRNTIF